MTKIARALAWKALILGIIGILTACQSLPGQGERGLKQRTPGVTTVRPLEKTTPQTLAEDFAGEPDGAPIAIGLALSGGGPRAAMFAHGVLQGLHDSGVLEQLDAISTVSGGGYAALWYYSKRLEMDRAGADYNTWTIFDDCVSPALVGHDSRPEMQAALRRAGQKNAGFKDMEPCSSKLQFKDDAPDKGPDPYRWQAHLARWPNLWQTAEMIPEGGTRGAPWPEARRLALATTVKPSAVKSAYQRGIERTWGLNPNPRAKAEDGFSYSNDNGETPQTPRWHMDPDKATWSQLRKLHDAKGQIKLPLWIVNTSDAPSRRGRRDQIRIFEITAYGQGSERNGYLRRGDTEEAIIYDLGTSVRASAASIDSQFIGKSRTLRFMYKYLFPFTKWGEPVPNIFQTSPKKPLHLSDGGHSENLGVYSLMRRGARDIIVVDATEDVEGKMKDLCTLRDMLGEEKVTLTFDDAYLKDFDRVCEKEKGYNVSEWKNPVVRGQAIWPAKSGLGPTRIWLIKLGWNQKQVEEAFTEGDCETPKYPVSCMVTVFYGNNSIKTVKKGDKESKMVFPQLTTAGAGFNSSTNLFWAYRELGRTAASTLSVKDGTLVLQPRGTAGPTPQQAERLCRKRRAGTC